MALGPIVSVEQIDAGGLPFEVRDGVPFTDAAVGHYVYGISWTKDGSELLIHRTNRRQNVMELAACHPITGVCRTVVREAVKSLVAKGLLTSGPKVGTRVLPPENWNCFDEDVVAWHVQAGLTPEFVRDLQDLRRVMEPAAVRLAAERVRHWRSA